MGSASVVAGPETRFTPRTHQFCAGAGIALAVVYLLGFIVFARFYPPPGPDMPPEELVAWLLRYDDSLRFGYILMICGGAIFGFWGASIAVWTRKSEASLPVMYVSQVVALGAAVAIFVAVPVFWAEASFRAGQVAPETTQMLWDLGWFMFLFAVPPFITWAVSLALSILWNPADQQVYPRWLGWVTLGETVCWTPALLVVYFYDGPFAYNGAVALYLPFTLFFGWVLVVSGVTLRVIRDHERTACVHGGVYAPHRELLDDRSPGDGVLQEVR